MTYALLLIFALPTLSAGLTTACSSTARPGRTSSPAPRRRPAALAAPLLVLRPSRGLHHDPARVRDHLGGPAGLLPQADLRLQGSRDLDGVAIGFSRFSSGRTTCSRSGCRSALDVFFCQHDDHRDPDRREDLQLGRDDLAGNIASTRRCSSRSGFVAMFIDRRPLGDLPGGVPDRLAGDGHLLRRRAPPLRALRRLDLRDLRRPLLLVAEDVRADARRAPGADARSGSVSSAST